MTAEEYKKHETTAINHFKEKLLTLKDRMETKTGKQIAESRHSTIESFLYEFHKEWNADDLCLK